MSLTVTGLSGGYVADVPILRDIEFSLDGAALGIIGRNGAGKSCLAQMLSGALRPTAGTVRLGDVDLTSTSSRHRVRAGISLVPEGRLIFGQLTVRENLVVAAHAAGRKAGARAFSRLEETFPVLGQKRSRPAASLSGGEQQLLAIARALIQEPQVIVLDEPSLGLSPIAVDNLTDTLDAIVEQTEVAMILMEQNGQLLTDLCERVLLMEQGVVTNELDMSVKDDQAVVYQAYLGL